MNPAGGSASQRNFIISECEEAKEDLGIKMSMCCFKAPPNLANWECKVVKPLLMIFAHGTGHEQRGLQAIFCSKIHDIFHGLTG